MAHGPSLLRVMELSALLIQSQKQNEEKEKTMKTLNNTVEILVCFTFIWEIAQCLLGLRSLFYSLSTKRCGFLKRKRSKDASCAETSGTCLAHVESVQVQAMAGELQTSWVPSLGRFY